VYFTVGSPGQFPECLTLDLSNNSGSLPSGRLSALSQHSEKSRSKSPNHSEDGQEKEDIHDAWDSWDDEEDEVSEGQSRNYGITLSLTVNKDINS